MFHDRLSLRLIGLIVLISNFGFSFARSDSRFTNSTTLRSTAQLSAASFAVSSTLSSSSVPAPAVTGLEDASRCWDEWITWSSWSYDCPKSTIYGPSTTQIATLTSTEYETYKLCDGHPRVNATVGWRTWFSTYTLEYVSSTPTGPDAAVTVFPETEYPSGKAIATVTTTLTVKTRYPTSVCASSMPKPRCSIDQNTVCHSLWDIWTSKGYPNYQPPCTYTQWGACNGCELYIPFAKLLYFPVQMTGNFCGGDYRTVTAKHNANVSTPTTVVWSGTTLTSGYAYLSYAGITAGHCGTPKPAGLIPIPTSEVFSYRGHAAALPQLNDTKWPFNFADLAPNQVPWEAWIGQDTCYNHEHSANCQTITQEAYRPWLVYPTQVWEIDPRYKGCTSGAFGIFDPPTALPVADGIAKPTMSREVSDAPMTASPGSNRPSLSPSTLEAGSTATQASKVDPENPSIETDRPQTPADPEDPNKQSKSTAMGASLAPSPSLGSSLLPHTADPSAVSSPPVPQPAPSADPDGVAEPQQTTLVPLSALMHSPLPIGTMTIQTASEAGAISFGTHLVHQGEQTMIEGTILSVGSATILVEHAATPAQHTSSRNALSVLRSAQVDNSPLATFQIGKETVTAYPGGVLDGFETTRTIGDAPTMVGGHTVQIKSGAVVVDSSTVAPVRITAETNAYTSAAVAADDPNRTDVPLTYIHGTIQTTLTGHIDPQGHTIVSGGAEKDTYTYSGQVIVQNGVTYSTIVISGSGSSLPPMSASSLPLPSVVTESLISSTLPPIVPARSSETRAKTTAETTSGAYTVSGVRWVNIWLGTTLMVLAIAN